MTLSPHRGVRVPNASQIAPARPLVIADLHYRAGGPLSLRVNPGETVCLSGESGSGKTLLLRAIADLDPHDGEIRLGDTGQHTIAATAWRRQVGMLPAESAWWGGSVCEHLDGAPSAWLEILGFTAGVMDWQIARLSSGERQRLALLRMLARQPAALLLDEPTANLDLGNSERVEHLIAAYQRSRSAPVLWVTHDPSQAARVSKQHLQLSGGRLIGPEGGA